MRAGAEGAYGRVLALESNMAKSPTVVAMFGGGRGVDSLDAIVATEDRNLGEIS